MSDVSVLMRCPVFERLSSRRTLSSSRFNISEVTLSLLLTIPANMFESVTIAFT